MASKSKDAGLGIALGAAAGAAAGVLAGHVAIWLAVGVAIGMAIGAGFRTTKIDCPECAAHQRQHETKRFEAKARG
jgi:hypothetical protein